MAEIEVERDGAVVTITINRPRKRNALTEAMYDRVSDELRAIDHDPGVLAAVITGAGDKAFSAGADLSQITSVNRARPPWQPSRFDSGQVVRTPLVAAIEGYCVAGGLELALACDVRVAGAGARFGFPEVKRGLVAGYGAHVLPRVIGLSSALLLLLTGRMVDAAEAHRLGLVQEVVPDGGSLAAAVDLAREIAANGQLAVQLTKEIASRSFETPTFDALRQVGHLQRLVAVSDEMQEGTSAFAEGRSASFPAATR